MDSRPASARTPISLISGELAVFCETVFESVKVPKENLVGELNKGWDRWPRPCWRTSGKLIGGFGLSRAAIRPRSGQAGGAGCAGSRVRSR